MQSFDQAREAAEVYSPAEVAFNRRRRTAGLFLAPAAFLLIWALPFDLPVAAHRLAAIFGLVVVLWLSEALPLPVTALLGPALAVVLGVASARTALAPFADPIIFLVIGGFILAQAMFVHGVDRRIAYTALSFPAVRASALRILLVYGAVCTALSMWISNTATTAMMFPIGLSIVAHLSGGAAVSPVQVHRFGMAMMLVTAFGASIGGMGTPVGTAPNLIGIGMLQKLTGTQISFFQWMVIGVPIVIVMFTALIAQFHYRLVRGLPIDANHIATVQQELLKLERLTPGERNVLMAFGLTVVLWVAPGAFTILGLDDTALARWYATALPDSVVAIIGAVLLFLLPIDWRARRFTLTWDEAMRIEWGIVLLFGGGLALGELAFATGLAKAMGEAITSLLPSQSTLALTMVFTAAAIVLSETASNTASANMIVPIAIAVSEATNVRAIEPALGATLGASMGFMLPISTPPNAIVYSSGYIPIGQMMRTGVILDVIGFVVIVSAVMTLGPLVF